MNVSVDGVAESTMGPLVSGNYFNVLGVPPVAGRVFGPEDDRIPGAHPVAVISHAYWQQRLGGSADAIGKKILIAGTPFTIIGVTPPRFFGLQVGDAPEISAPLMMQPQVMPDKESRSEEHTSELQSQSFISYAVFCLKIEDKNLNSAVGTEDLWRLRSYSCPWSR